MTRILDWTQERTADDLAMGSLSSLRGDIGMMENLGKAAEKLDADDRPPTLRELVEAADSNLADPAVRRGGPTRRLVEGDSTSKK